VADFTLRALKSCLAGRRAAVVVQQLRAPVVTGGRIRRPRGVRENIRSTERQYALAEEAVKLGWEAERVVVLDGDLGISGLFSDTGRWSDRWATA
jgi:hypothetical protein